MGPQRNGAEQAPSSKKRKLEEEEGAGKGARQEDNENKKRKRSKEGEEGGAEEDQEEEEEGEEESEDSDEENEELISKVGEVAQSESSDQIAQSGTIKKVVLWNFMCHENFEIDFESNINFITGPNGSGKSAILTAISVCLGGRASKTERASNLKAFIKSGAKSGCKIALTIRNEGKEAFRPDVYKEDITVERTINAAGQSSYRILNKTTVKSRSKKDLDAIVDHFSFQVENPFMILTQDVAREFLTNSSPTELYKQFMRGTLLEQIREDLNQVVTQEKQAKETLEFKKPSLDEMKQEITQLHARLKEFEQLDKINEEMNRLKMEMAWAQVIEKEGELEKLELDLQKTIDKIARKQKSKQDATEKYHNTRGALDNFEEKISELRAKIAEINQSSGEHERMFKEEKKRLDDMKRDAIKVQSDIRSLEEDRKDLERRIDKERKDTSEEMRDRDRQRLERLREEVQRLEDKISQLTNKREKLIAESGAENLRDKIEEAQREYSEARARLNETAKAREDLKRRKENSLRSYGEHIPEVLDTISKTRFRGPVIGPIGKHIKLRDNRWSVAMNEIVGGVFPNFIVQNFEDSQTLRNILRRHRCNNPIVTRRELRCPDVTQHMPSSEFTRVLDILQCDEEGVKAYLIDARRVERIILAQNQDEAFEIIYRRRPQNVDQCYTIDAALVQSREGMSEYFAMTKGNSRVKYFDDVDQQLRDAEHSIERQKTSLPHLEKSMNDLKEKASNFQREMNSIDRELASCTKEHSRKQIDLEGLQDKINQEKPSNILVLETERQKTVDEIELQKRQLATLAEAVNQKVEELKEMQKETQAIKSKTRPYQDEIVRLQDEQAQSEEFDEKFRSFVAKTDQELEAMEKERQRKQVAVEERRQEVESMSAKARLISEEKIRSRKSPYQLDKELEKMGAMLKQQAAKFGDRDALYNEFTQKHGEYLTFKDNLKNSAKLVNRIHLALKEREALWEEYKKALALRSKFFFIRNLSHRGYDGQLKFNHKEKKLRILVKTHDEKNETSTRQLSGGERSFSTVSFLLSLWEVTECPFRALDEYDVFMDAVNRRISTSLIIDVAKTTKNRQFILISPQDMSNVNLEGVNVIRLEAPRG